MPRIRSIKPTFARSRSVKKLNDRQKLVWVCLWPVADDHGRVVDEPGQLVGDLWALSLTEAKLDQVLTELHEFGRLIRYEFAGERYIQITNWTEHQKISHPTDSLIPPVPFANDSGMTLEGSGLEGRGKERKGGEPPSSFCSKHPSGTDQPCRGCGDARRAADAVILAVKNKPTPAPPRKEDLCVAHEWNLAANCPDCAREAVA